MNILITSAGRRGYLIRYFREALNGRGKVIAGNSIDNVPSFREADEKIVTPMIYDAEYIPFLLRYCKEHSIDAILSLYDVDVPILAAHKAEFAAIGTKLVISNESFARVCNDKWLTHLFLKENKFNVPQTYMRLIDAEQALCENKLQYPVIVKPRFGNGSIGLNIAYDEEELKMLFSLTEKIVRRSWLRFESEGSKDIVIVQEMLPGKEYGIDILNDLNAVTQGVVIKQKLAMRSGETDSAIVVDEPLITTEAKRLGRLTGHIGNLDCDGFYDGNSFHFLELNARFGGGYPFSHIAGANFPLAIVNWLLGEKADESILRAKNGVMAYKDIEIRIS